MIKNINIQLVECVLFLIPNKYFSSKHKRAFFVAVINQINF